MIVTSIVKEQLILWESWMIINISLAASLLLELRTSSGNGFQELESSYKLSF